MTKECLDVGIAAASKKGARILDVGAAVFKKAFSEHGYGVVRDYTGHGVGFDVHEEPEVPNFIDRSFPNPRIKPGLVFAIEPMINMGEADVWLDDSDGWTVRTVDGQPSAQWEIQVLVTTEGYEVISD